MPWSSTGSAASIEIAVISGLNGSYLTELLLERVTSCMGSSADHHQLPTASCPELDLLDGLAAEGCFGKYQPKVVVLAAAKVGGIQANSSYPAGFFLEKLKIQTNVIATAWVSGVHRLFCSWAAAASIRSSPSSRSRKKHYSEECWGLRTSGQDRWHQVARGFAPAARI